MSSLDVFVLIVVPITVVLLCGIALLVQRRAERAVQEHVVRLAALRAERQAADIFAGFNSVGVSSEFIHLSNPNEAAQERVISDQLSLSLPNGKPEWPVFGRRATFRIGPGRVV